MTEQGRRPKFRSNVGKFLFFTFWLTAFFFAFQFNLFRSAPEEMFKDFQVDSETLVVGRVIDSHHYGFLSHTALMGRFGGYGIGRDAFQLTLFANDETGTNFVPYTSQVGLQGTFFSVIDQALRLVDVTSKTRLFIFRAIASGLLAVVLAWLVVLIARDFSYAGAIALGIGIVYSQWLVVFGRNIYWVTALAFLPMLVVSLLARKNEAKGWKYCMALFLAPLLAVCLKCLCGYEYITTILIASVIPIVLYGIRYAVPPWRIAGRMSLVGVGGLLGFAAAMGIHVAQLSQEFGSHERAVAEIRNRATIRTHGDPKIVGNQSPYYKSMQATTAEVINKYWNGRAINLRSSFGFEFFRYIDFEDLVLFFGIFTALSLMSGRYCPAIKEHRQKLVAMDAALWLSVAAPLSWFVLAKSHSYIHTHINHILWQVPFTLLGFALVGAVTGCIANDLSRRYRWKFYAAVGSIPIIVVLYHGFSFFWEIRSIDKTWRQKINEKTLIHDGEKIDVYLADNELIYVVNPENIAATENVFFVHAFPIYEDDLPEQRRRHGYANVDFRWDQRDESVFSRCSCFFGKHILVRKLPEFAIRSLRLGQFVPGRKRLWETYYQLDQRPYMFSPCMETDRNWVNGISRKSPAFFVEENPVTRQNLIVGRKVTFEGSGRRNIVKVQRNGAYINVTVDGDLLDPIQDGAPNQIEVYGPALPRLDQKQGSK